MIEIKNIKLLKVCQVDEFGYCNYLVYFMENDDVYEVYLQNKNYGTMMFLYGVPKEQETLEDFLNCYNFDEYIQEYQELYEKEYDENE